MADTYDFKEIGPSYTLTCIEAIYKSCVQFNSNKRLPMEMIHMIAKYLNRVVDKVYSKRLHFNYQEKVGLLYVIQIIS